MKKKISDSYTEQVYIVTKQHLNGSGRLFGGQIMQWIDTTAAVAARRHSQRNVTTAAVDCLEFKGPAYEDDMIVLTANVTYTGRTSMEVGVKSYVEALNGERTLINQAYVVMVALDNEEKPTVIPQLLLENEEQNEQWEQAKKRYDKRRQA